MSRPGSTSLFPELGFGLGLRPAHYADVLEGRSRASWFEVISENFMIAGGRPLLNLEKIRRDFPLVFHGVSLSVASADPLDTSYLKRLKAAVDRFQPAIVSDHCCWTGVNGQNLHDLLPVPFTEEALSHIVPRVQRVQDFLGRRILLENVSSYFTYSHSEMTEWEFFATLAERADCGLLFDINNVYVSSVNHGFDPGEFLAGIPRERVGQFHLAGHSTMTTETGETHLIDTHDEPVCEEVWQLYAAAARRFGRVNTMIERDSNIPEYSELEAELDRARLITETAEKENYDDQNHHDRSYACGSPERGTAVHHSV